MATRAKPKEIVDATQKPIAWVKSAGAIIALVIAIITIGYFGYQALTGLSHKEESAKGAATPFSNICPDVSAKETRLCVVTTEWSNWIQFADGSIDNGKQICFPLGIMWEKKDIGGATFWRFKTDSGKVHVKYRLFPATDTCSSVTM